MIILNHVFPEICVYRTEPMQKIFFSPYRAFLFFVHLGNILDHGDVAFLLQPVLIASSARTRACRRATRSAPWRPSTTGTVMRPACSTQASDVFSTSAMIRFRKTSLLCSGT